MGKRKIGQDLSSGHSFIFVELFLKLNCFLYFIPQVALSFQKCILSLHLRVVICIRIGFIKILQTDRNMSGAQDY